MDHVNGAEVLDERPSPSPSPRPSPPPSSPSLFFSGATTEDDSPIPSPSASPEDVDGSASEPGWPSDEVGEIPDPTSSRDSSGSPLLSKAQLKDTFRAGVRIGTSTAHRVAARTPGQQHVGLFLADDDDVKGIGDPLAEIAHRRGGLAGGKISPDTNNALQAAMALAGYVAKQLKGFEQARQIDAQILHGGQPPADGEVA